MSRLLPADSEVPDLVLGPDSITWDRASDVRGFFLAGTALLLQVAHPTVGAGVRDFSNFEKEPWDRLLRTVDYVNLSVYGGTEAAAVGRRLRKMHRPIKGTQPDGSRYHALEPEAYAWVHGTLAEAIVVAHQRFGRPMSPNEVERFYREWLRLGRFVGVRTGDLPSDWTGFRAYFDEMVADRLEHNDTVDRVLRSLTRVEVPPLQQIPSSLWRVLRIAPARALTVSTIGSLPPLLRERFGIRWTARNETELKALAATSRAVTPLMPKRLKVSGPAYLRWRRRAIARGPLGPGADRAARHAAQPRQTATRAA